MGTLSNIKVEPCQVSWNAVDLGFTDGDISIKFKEGGTPIGAHQVGKRIMDVIRNNDQVEEISVTLKESSVAQLKSLFVAGPGSNFTPVSGTEVFGRGSSKFLTSMFADAQKLVLHPVVLGASDHTRDMAFWKAVPMLETIVLSGENPEHVSVSFKIFPDTTKNSKVDQFIVGDHTQAGI